MNDNGDDYQVRIGGLLLGFSFCRPSWMAAREAGLVGGVKVEGLRLEIQEFRTAKKKSPFLPGGSGEAGGPINDTCVVFGMPRGCCGRDTNWCHPISIHSAAGLRFDKLRSSPSALVRSEAQAVLPEPHPRQHSHGQSEPR